MGAYNQGTTDLKKKDLVSLVNLAAAYLQAKKVRDLILSEIRQCSKEIEHLRDRIAAVEGQVKETRAAIASIEPGVTESRSQLLGAEAEKRAIEEEAAEIEDFHTDVANKQAMLPGLRLQVAHLKEEVHQEALRREAVQARYREAVVRKQEIAEEVVSLKARLRQLQQEIPIMQNTRDILVGQMPEHFDPQVFQKLQGDQGMNFESFVSEVQNRIAVLKKEIAVFQAQLAEEDRESGALSGREHDLRREVAELSHYADIAAARESVMREVYALEEEQAHQGRALEAQKRELQGLESGISGLDEEISRELRREQELSGRLAYLEARAQVLGGIVNFPERMDKLKRQASRLEISWEVQNSFFGMMNNIREEVEAMNASLRESATDYQGVFDKLAEARRWLEEE